RAYQSALRAAGMTPYQHWSTAKVSLPDPTAGRRGRTLADRSRRWRPAINRVIPAARRADWYARRVGVAAAREINEIPAARQSTDGSRVRAAGISEQIGGHARNTIHRNRF